MDFFIYRKNTSEAVKEYWDSISKNFAMLLWCGGLANLVYSDNPAKLNRVGDLVECFKLCYAMELKRLGIKIRKRGNVE